MIQIIRLKGKDKHLYRLPALMVMDSEVIRTNNSHSFKTGKEYVWFIATEDKEVVGSVPVEQKSRKKAVISNYYVKVEGTVQEEIPLRLSPVIVAEFRPESWLLNSIILVQDKETSEKFEFVSMDKKWTRYAKTYRQLMTKKKIVGTKNVYELAQGRLKAIFNEFDNIYVSLSGGKDNEVLLSMRIDHIRKNNLKVRLGAFHMNYEIQYKMTIDYVDRMLEASKDILDVYRVCIPFHVATCTLMYQSFWRPWEDGRKNIWVRSMSEKAMTKEGFSFYNTTM